MWGSAAPDSPATVSKGVPTAAKGAAVLNTVTVLAEGDDTKAKFGMTMTLGRLPAPPMKLAGLAGARFADGPTYPSEACKL